MGECPSHQSFAPQEAGSDFALHPSDVAAVKDAVVVWCGDVVVVFERIE